MERSASLSLPVPLIPRIGAGPFIYRPWQDILLILCSPAIALLLAFLFFRASSGVAAVVFARVFTSAHIVLVFARSHANPRIFRAHPFRFTLVPIALFILALRSEWGFRWLFAIGTLWDVYHSSLQTFGIARIYDRRMGNDPRAGRRLDQLLCLFLYIGPLLASRNLAALLGTINGGPRVIPVFEWLFGLAQAHWRSFGRWELSLGLAFFIYYFGSYLGLAREGYRHSLQKVLLLAVSGAVSFFSWRSLSFLAATFVVNIFHALQYFAIVWWAEKANLSRLAARGRVRGECWTLTLLLLVTFGYGTVLLLERGSRVWLCLGIVFSLMHYWYDGFIWSVRKGQVG